jgi:hypothetical protein
MYADVELTFVLINHVLLLVIIILLCITINLYRVSKTAGSREMKSAHNQLSQSIQEGKRIHNEITTNTSSPNTISPNTGSSIPPRE